MCFQNAELFFQVLFFELFLFRALRPVPYRTEQKQLFDVLLILESIPAGNVTAETMPAQYEILKFCLGCIRLSILSEYFLHYVFHVFSPGFNIVDKVVDGLLRSESVAVVIGSGATGHSYGVDQYQVEMLG